MDATFQLIVAPELEPFRPEIDYVFTCLERRFHIRRESQATTRLYYGTGQCPGDVAAIPPHFFPTAISVDDDGVRLQRAAFDHLAMSPGWKPRSPVKLVREHDLDLIGLIFFLLSGIEERDAARTDRYGRFTLAQNWLEQCGLFGVALADRALEALAKRITVVPEPRACAFPLIMPTHDVDRLRAYHRWYDPARYAAGDIVKRGKLKRGIKHLSAWFRLEPWNSARRIMQLSEELELASRFYFMGPSDAPQDSPYAVRDAARLRALLGEITARGHVSGFHPGFNTATSAVEWRTQHLGLQAITNSRPLDEGRQHALRYDIAKTPAIWAQAGMELDLSCGFPERSGFRNGAAHFHPAYDLVNRSPLNVLRGATSIMDFGFFGGKYRDLSEDAALAEADAVMREAVAVGGHIVLLFHTGHTEARHWSLYERIIRRAHELTRVYKASATPSEP